jgi:hypothetical protein
VLHFVKTDGKRINTEMEPGIGLVLFLLSYYPVTATLLGGIIHTTAKIGVFFFFFRLQKLHKHHCNLLPFVG